MIDTLVGGPVILVGHSMGGVIATQAADRYPHLVRALALVDSPLDLARHDDPTVAPEFIRERLHQITTWTPEQIMAKGIADHPGWHADEFAWWAQAKADVEPRLLEAQQGWAGLGFDDLPRITLPAHFIAGDPATGSMVTSAQLDRVRDAWGPDSATIIPNAGHDVHKDARAEFTRVLDDFLTRVSA
jgi:pimeloyl-ACP methyl ester carboxylesterase